MIGAVAQRTAANRRRLADFFDGLDDAQLETPSLCGAWTVHQVVGHLVTPLAVRLPKFLLLVVRHRGSFDRASEAAATRLAERPMSDLTALLRDKADVTVPAPGVGPMGQMADGCIHLRDCARPLGLDADVSLSDWRMVLDFLPTRPASLGLVPRGRLDGLGLRADDQDWSWGDGAEVTGPSEALALAVTGRHEAVDDLDGPGLVVLRERLTTP